MQPAVRFNATLHQYHIGTQRIRSVTDALSVVTNFDHVPPATLEAARIFGHHVHKMVHLFNIGELHEGSLDPVLARRLFQYKRFLHETTFEVTHAEEIVVDASYRYCGTLDMRGRWRARKLPTLALIDLKSGAIPKTVGYQTAGYREAVAGEKPRLRFALQLLDDRYRLVPLTEQSDWAAFLSCLNVYKISLKENPYDEKTFTAGRSAATADLDTDTPF